MQVFRRSDRSPLAEWWRTVDKGLIAAALILLGAGLVLSLAAGDSLYFAAATPHRIRSVSPERAQLLIVVGDFGAHAAHE